MSKVGSGIDLDDDYDEDDFEDDSDDSSDDDDSVIISDEDDSDTSDTAIRRITASLPSGKSGVNARRRVEDYLEMRRAARELKDLEDFDFD